MARKRNPENRGLPKRWRRLHGAYFYQVPAGLEKQWDGKKQFRLGKTLPEAYKAWAERLQNIDKAKTVNDLLDRYYLEIVPTKAIATQYYNALYIKTLRSVFGHMLIEDVKPVDIYRYLDKRSQKKDGRGGLSIAKREIHMFSDAYFKAVQWGYIEKHPFKGQIEYKGEKGRDRYVENWELDEFLSICPEIIKAYTNLKILTGLRQQDLLSIKVANFTDIGIEVDIRKTGKKITIEWTDALRSAVDCAISVRPVDISPYVFCTRRGKSYYNPDKPDAASGWKTIWRRYMDKALKETSLKVKFTEHDLRAKTASDLDDIEHARKLLAHTSQKMTQKYVRKRQIVSPAR